MNEQWRNIGSILCWIYAIAALFAGYAIEEIPMWAALIGIIACFGNIYHDVREMRKKELRGRECVVKNVMNSKRN